MYDFVFITHLPSFYKVNLYNEIGKRARVHVIFISDGSVERMDDFVTKGTTFSYEVLNSGPFQIRRVFRSLLRMLRALRRMSCKQLIVGGWELPEFWLSIFLSNAEKKGLALESNYNRVEPNFIKVLLKKLFLNCIDILFASGRDHVRFANAYGYRGESIITNGVGMIFRHKSSDRLNNRTLRKRILFVGRLAPEKNLGLLIELAEQHQDYQFTLVGTGPEEERLRQAIETENLHNFALKGYVKNNDLNKVFNEYDFLILPSEFDAWGLVIEEALYAGLPVIVSDRCGGKELLENAPEPIGFIFPYQDPSKLHEFLNQMNQDSYERIKIAVERYDLNQKDDAQVQAYLGAIGK